eukprot:5143228-Amphidinium_carterae.1
MDVIFLVVDFNAVDMDNPGEAPLQGLLSALQQRLVACRATPARQPGGTTLATKIATKQVRPAKPFPKDIEQTYTAHIIYIHRFEEPI